MSRVHDALRKAEQLLEAPGSQPAPGSAGGSHDLIGPDSAPGAHRFPAESGVAAGENPANGLAAADPHAPPVAPPLFAPPTRLSAPGGVARADTRDLQVDWRNFLARCKTIPFRPAPEAHLINLERPHEVPGEEFRSLRTRLNHMQSQQDLHAIVVTSASPAEGKTFTAINLALTQAQLESPVLIADFDLRRPVVSQHVPVRKDAGVF